MTTKLGLGIPMPLLAPSTATWAIPFAAYYIFLQNRVVLHRLSTKTYMGDNSSPSKSTSDPLYKSSRCQVNFIENVPLALMVALLAELNGANRTYINYGLGALFALRVSHAEFGVMSEGSLAMGRPVGYYGTQAVITGLIGYVGYLVQGYWST
ncbi:hypothetical protein P154DRAFT_522528 [Amniculicola lignicola CBS 123094]|uniref:Membrane-associated proteins in eicosanoid and glutathione metabolism n=1 Tax=Amniculicola lignicola CBS 123094 TaxID=1392246 RepID=A0A6A5WFC8_9PLEO|nr:hypothetical protein P154DRAFT_522528 [Amniculicola lignicola CBS 123094]